MCIVLVVLVARSLAGVVYSSWKTVAKAVGLLFANRAVI